MSVRDGRLIELRSAAAAANMATDQALLESVDAGGGPVLRFYTWSEPTLSLGYFQRVQDRLGHCESGGLCCVRRASGGGAIIHHHELTYSIAIPVDGGAAGGSEPLYRRTHQAIALALADFGPRPMPFRLSGLPASDANPFLCFQRRSGEDLVVGGYKVLGSAQRRSRRAVLQHGSLLLRASRFAPQLPGIFDLGSRFVPIRQIAQRISEALSEALAVRWTPGKLSPHEIARSNDLTHQRFASQRWVNRR